MDHDTQRKVVIGESRELQDHASWIRRFIAGTWVIEASVAILLLFGLFWAFWS